MDPQTAEFIYKSYNNVLKTGKGTKIVYEIIRKNRHRRTVEDSVSVIRNDSGRPIGFRFITRDITDRIRAEKELAQHRSRLEAIFSSVKDAIITVDRELRVIETNKSTEDICGMNIKDIAGKLFIECPVQCGRFCHDVLKQTLEKEATVKDFQIECKNKKRENQIVNVTSSPLRDPDGNFMGAVMVIRDITKISDLERKLRGRHNIHNIIGESKKMQEIFDLLKDLTDLETTVLLTGESGTGKDVIAKALAGIPEKGA